MKDRRGGHRIRGTPPESAPSRPEPKLPAWKAFVVQFSRETGPTPGVFSGRVEHLSSGQRVRFSSGEELLAILGKLLGELGTPNATQLED
jgi:hypothetical protein